jgi:hypothetical protein
MFSNYCISVTLLIIAIGLFVLHRRKVIGSPMLSTMADIATIVTLFGSLLFGYLGTFQDDQPVFSTITQETPAPTQTIPVPLKPSSTVTDQLSIPTITPIGTLLFQDKFDSDPNPSWEFVTGDWAIINGQLSLRNAADGSSFGIARIGESTWTDYSIGVTISGLKDGWYSPAAFTDDELNKMGERPSRAAVLVRVQENNDSIALIIAEHYLEWAYFQGGKWNVVSGTLVEAFGESGARFDIVAQGNTFSVKVNGSVISSFTDSQTYQSGKVGFWLKSGTEVPPTDWRAIPKIDDLIIYQLP